MNRKQQNQLEIVDTQRSKSPLVPCFTWNSIPVDSSPGACARSPGMHGREHVPIAHDRLRVWSCRSSILYIRCLGSCCVEGLNSAVEFIAV